MRTKNNLPLFLTLIAASIFLFASYIPNFYEASVVNLLPPDREMIWGEHIYTYDYNVYLSKIRQGMEGEWAVVDKYHNNPNQKGVFLQMIYLLSGKIGGLLQLTPALTFHLMRTILSFAFIATIIYLNIYFLKKPWAVFWGTLLGLLAASFPVFYSYLGETWVGIHMPWWQEMDVLKHISYVPHYTLNYIIVILFSILIYDFARRMEHGTWNMEHKTRSTKHETKLGFTFHVSRFTLICLLLFFSFFIHPAAGALFFFLWGIYHFLNFVWFKSYNIKTVLNITGYTIILGFVALTPLLYARSVTSAYPWKALVEFDSTYRLPVDLKEYILALGPIFFTGVSGLILALIKKKKEMLSMISWIGGAFLAIIVFKKIPIFAELRFVQTANQIPLAVLTVYFLFELKTYFMKNRNGKESEDIHFERLGIPRKLAGRVPTGVKNVVSSFLIYGVITGILSLGIVQSYFSIKAQTDFIHQRAVAGNPLVPYPPQVMYPLKDFYNSLLWLEKNTSRNSVVLSKITAGNYIPAYSGNFVYLGHNPESPNYDLRVEKVNTFFSDNLTKNEALTFLKNENISYVFYGPQEKENLLFVPKNYVFLKEVFTSGFVNIYQVNK